MTRPQIIRADTIDLQDQGAPSAKDHTRHPTSPAATWAGGPTAPHQAETLRDVAAEINEEQHRSPRVSTEWTDVEDGRQDYAEDETSAGESTSLDGANPHNQDSLAVAQNRGLAGATSEDADMADAEGDDSLDDDMMDKISSSPSIDDGGYFLPKSWPQRVDSLSQFGTPPVSKSLGSSERSSSPFVETPVHYPLLSFREQSDLGPYHPNRYNVISAYPASKYEASNHLESSSVFEDVGNQSAALALVGDVPDLFEDEERDHLTPLPDDDWIDNYDDDFDVGAASNNLAVQEALESDCRIDDEYDAGIMTIPYESSEEDDGHDLPYPEDPRMVDSGWGGDCLQDIEDIDFEFVYALHTFVATVEGQANATKGDTMVLLDDSNSYWWLVRIVKDSSIGYLPAEHIETPTERLARLNKHRNIDLSATMLGDQADKPKNPLKKAMRRRNAKTVQFAPPTYVEASDNDYSSDDEDGEAEYFAQQQSIDAQRTDLDEDEIAAVEPLSVKSQTRDPKASVGGKDVDSTIKAVSDNGRTSDEIFDGKSEGSGRSRNGTVRNTDSFFKDDSVETRKITITPALFRDDSSTSTRTSNDSKELRQRVSLDKVEVEAIPEKGKDDKKKKEKKSGLLGNIFRRKDKKSKSQDEDPDELIYGKKSSEETRASLDPNKDSDDFGQNEEPISPEQQSPQWQPGKSQQQQRQETSVVDTKQSVLVVPSSPEPQQVAAPERRAPPTISAIEPSMRIVAPENQQSAETAVQQIRTVTPESTRTPLAMQSQQSEPRTTSTFSRIMRSASGSEPKPEKVKKAKSRVELDDFDSSPEASPVEELPEEPVMTPLQRPIPGAFPDSYMTMTADENPQSTQERLSESPVQVSPVSNPPALVVDTSSQEEVPSPVSSPSPELVDIEEGQERKVSERSVSASTTTPTWNDTHFRTFFDDDGDIKDLLVVVYDKSGVVPAGPDHPLIGKLFKEENEKLAEITNRLDSMLGEWLARKSRSTMTQ